MSKKTHSLEACRRANDRAKDTKNKTFRKQKNAIFLYLKENTATATMITEATAIPQKNICRYKRDLEDAGKLWEVEKTLYKVTKHKAWYLTSNRKLAEHFNLV